MSDLQSLLDRNDRLLLSHRKGYNLFANTVDDGHCRQPSRMTYEDIVFWDKQLDEWEALDEAEKCQYDVLVTFYVDVLSAREHRYSLGDSISVGIHVVGMAEELETMSEADAQEWLDWHDKWENMDKGTQDSYLILLALKED